MFITLLLKGIDGKNLKKDPEKLKLVEQIVQEEDVVEVRNITKLEGLTKYGSVWHIILLAHLKLK